MTRQDKFNYGSVGIGSIVLALVFLFVWCFNL